MAVSLLHGAEQTAVRACLWCSLTCCPVLPLLPSCTGDQHVIIVTNCLKRVLRKLKSLNRFPIHFIPPGLSLGGPQPLPCSSPLCSPYLPNTQVINKYSIHIHIESGLHICPILIFYMLNTCSPLIFLNTQPGKQLPACQSIPLPASHRFNISTDIIRLQYSPIFSAPPHHHHHHYSLGVSDHAVQPDKEPVANAPLGKPQLENSRTESKILDFRFLVPPIVPRCGEW